MNPTDDPKTQNIFPVEKLILGCPFFPNWTLLSYFRLGPDRCEFEIDKISYSKLLSRATYYVTKTKPSVKYV